MDALESLFLDYDRSPLEALPDISRFAHLENRVRFGAGELPGPLDALMARDTLPLPPRRTARTTAARTI